MIEPTQREITIVEFDIGVNLSGNKAVVGYFCTVTRLRSPNGRRYHIVPVAPGDLSTSRSLASTRSGTSGLVELT